MKKTDNYPPIIKQVINQIICLNPLIILIPIALLYLSQNLYLPVTSMDEAQQADYLQRIISGKLPYRDFLDIYGPINWLPPAMAYKLFGGKWFGVRVWMLFIQIVILFLGFKITKLIADKFYAIWFFIVCLLFLGAPISQNYTPYAYMQSYPLTFGVVLLMFQQKFQINLKILFSIGVLMGTAIFLKISSGLFLLLSVLLISFFNIAPSGINNINPILKKSFTRKLLFVTKFIVVACYIFVFTFYIIPNYEKQYFWHLTLPTLIGIAVLLYMEIIKYITLPYSYVKNDLRRIKTCFIVGLSTFVTVILFMILFFPFNITGAMLNTFPKILSNINYSIKFSPLGKLAITEMESILTTGLWMQLPWISTFLFILILISFYLNKDDLTFKKNVSWKTRELFQCVSLWIITVLSHYVIYPTADQGHLIQSSLFWILFFCTGISFFERFAISVNLKSMFRVIISLLLIFWITPLLNINSHISMDLYKNNIIVPELEAGSYLLKYHYKEESYEYYKKLVQIGVFIRENSEQSDECFILSKDKLINFYAGKELYGSRDSFLFYLIPHGRLSRKNFINLSEPKTLNKLLNNPPKFIVDHDFNGGNVTKKIFPELNNLIASHYRKVFCKAQIVVYKLKF